MSGIFGIGRPAAIKPDYTGLQIQTAVNTLPIPIVWGKSRLSPNVIWYNNFQTAKGGKGGGKGGALGGGSQPDTYSAAVILALCEGPVVGIDQIWKNQSVCTLAELGLTLFVGTTPQSAWSYLASAYAPQALAYQGTAYVCAPNYQLGSAATLDNHNFEIEGFWYGSGVNGVDADPAQIVNDFLTNVQFGVGFPAGSIDATTLFGSGGDASYQTYCKAIGLCLSPALANQERASSILARWLELTNTAAVWSGGLLRFVPYGDTATVSGTNVATTQLRQIGLLANGQSNPSPIVVVNSAFFVSDGGVTYADTGAALGYIGTAYPATAGQYGMSPNGTYLFAAGDAGKAVNIAYTYAVAASYVPDVTPIYDLTDDDFQHEKGEDPLQVSRSDPYQAYNVWRLECADRSNAYNLTSIESRDQNAIELYGLRIAPTVTAHEVCDPNVASLAGQLMLQRAVYIRNTYKFRLSWEYCLLDPMDLVTVTDALLGLDKAPIRITEVDEDEDGFLSVTAEEFPLGVATATLYPVQSVTNNPINRGAAAAAVNTPIIFEPPAALVGTSPQVWIAASAGVGGAADPNWGGCNVWVSTDGATYSQIGSIVGATPMGELTAALPAFSGTNPDSGDVLAVDLTESAGTLSSVSDGDAKLAATLCIVGDELLSYATATLTSANAYSLTDLYRGLYGTSPDFVWPAGTPFAYLSGDTVFKYDLPPQYVGVKLSIKLQSFNIFGGGLQDISTCTAYAFTPTGGAVDHPAGLYLLTGTPLDIGSVVDAPIVADDFGTPFTLAVELDVDLGAA